MGARAYQAKVGGGVSDLKQTLAERGERYGPFSGHASIAQRIKSVMVASRNWTNLSAVQKQALDMIADKIGRILNGDPSYADSWIDIAGYVTLVVEDLKGESGA